MDYAREIKERLTARDVFERYGYSVNARGYVCCPFHGEKTPSCKVYDGNRGYHCFGCGSGGDVIDLVRKLFDLDFKSAISKINADFGLLLPIDHKLSYEEQKAAILAEIERKRAIKEREREWEAVKSEYMAALDEYVRLSRNRDKYRPPAGCEKDELHPLFVEAIVKLPHAEKRLDDAEIGVWKYEARNREHS